VGLEPRTVAAKGAPLRALIAHERVERVGTAGEVLAARDAARIWHHGDLRAASVSAAMELLEESGETALSLRSRAPCRGIPTAPYRHYDDREALVSAIASLPNGWSRHTPPRQPRSS
jgi:hypothetical protein